MAFLMDAMGKLSHYSISEISNMRNLEFIQLKEINKLRFFQQIFLVFSIVFGLLSLLFVLLFFRNYLSAKDGLSSSI